MSPYLAKRRTYRLFISHAWRYTKGYNRLVDLLEAAPRFQWTNYSAPRARPAVDSRTAVGKWALRTALKDQIRPVHCVLIIGGMYVAYREWIQTEISIATEFDKPMVGIRPWGQQRTPQAVVDAVDQLVGWNTASIVSAIRRNAL
jgi:hypothetical protein